MKAKTKPKGQLLEARYKPIDESEYPEMIKTKEFVYYRLWCRPYFIVYEKYRNGVRVGFYIFPGGVEKFQFKAMETYAEAIRSGELLCHTYVSK